MKSFETQLLREKFLIVDPAKEDGTYVPVKALSNRMVITFPQDANKDEETYVIRAHTMHLCIRMAAQILQSYRVGDGLKGRVSSLFWQQAFERIESEYDRRFNPNRWIAVYQDGKPVYGEHSHHAFLDVIEKCDFESDKDYDLVVSDAEAMFKKAGKIVRIEHEAHIAYNIKAGIDHGRFGVILRSPTKTTTFSYTLEADKEEETLNIPQSIVAGAAFLEGVELAFMIGMNMEKIRLGLIESRSDEDKKTRAAMKRLARLKIEIQNLEDNFTVRYRPDKPEFSDIEHEAEMLAKRILAPAEDAEFLDMEEGIKDDYNPSTKTTPRTKSAKNNV